MFEAFKNWWREGGSGSEASRPEAARSVGLRAELETMLRAVANGENYHLFFYENGDPHGIKCYVEECGPRIRIGKEYPFRGRRINIQSHSCRADIESFRADGFLWIFERCDWLFELKAGLDTLGENYYELGPFQLRETGAGVELDIKKCTLEEKRDEYLRRLEALRAREKELARKKERIERELEGVELCRKYDDGSTLVDWSDEDDPYWDIFF